MGLVVAASVLVPLLPGAALARPATPRQAFPMPADNPEPAAVAPSPAKQAAPAMEFRPRTLASDPGKGAFRYRLGPGDRLVMSVFKVEGYEAEVEVLSDGVEVERILGQQGAESGHRDSGLEKEAWPTRGELGAGSGRLGVVELVLD